MRNLAVRLAIAASYAATDGIFAVEDTQKIQAAVFGHHGVLKTGTLKVGDALTARVNITSACQYHA